MTPSPAPRETRPDIQALRAVAVGVVVLFHIGAPQFPGGFVGVDAFFVISGFLITTHLIEHAPKRPVDLVRFWGRRVRRLLPASLLVLTVTVIASWLLLASSQWPATARQAATSALYVVNWQLASDAVDYLSAEREPTAVQHYWSLAVEEQFYVVWPLLVLAVAVLAARHWRSRAYVAAFAAVCAASFAWSVHLTHADPPAAYFVTTTRMWELGIGGLLAAVLLHLKSDRLVPRGPAALGLALTGWAAIAAAAALFTTDTPFPGYTAALPVLGTAAVIGANHDLRLYSWRPIRWLGDVSYSVYLWHWPLVILLPLAIAKVAGTPERGPLDSVLIVVATLVLAGLTKEFVEDPFRTKAWTRRTVRTFVLAATGMAIVVSSSTALNAAAEREQLDSADQVSAAAASDPCFGAATYDGSPDCFPTSRVLTSPQFASADSYDAFTKARRGKDCMAHRTGFGVRLCSFGDDHGTVQVAHFGNSHATAWLPAVDAVATNNRWRVTTYLASQCIASDVPQKIDPEDAADNCLTWIDRAIDRMAEQGPDLIVFATNVGHPTAEFDTIEESLPTYRQGFRSVVMRLAKIAPVVLIRNSPNPTFDGLASMPDCVGSRELKDCSGPRSEWLPEDPMIEAGKGIRNVYVADLTKHFCDKTTCFGVVGGVIVFSDGHHLSATFSKSIAPFLEPALKNALAAG